MIKFSTAEYFPLESYCLQMNISYFSLSISIHVHHLLQLEYLIQYKDIEVILHARKYIFFIIKKLCVNNISI